jgi:hypothetical protein
VIAIIRGLQEGLIASTPKNKNGSMFELSIKFSLDLELTLITSSDIFPILWFRQVRRFRMFGSRRESALTNSH